MTGVGSFFEAAGRSLGAAQGSLAGPASEVPTAMVISEAELQVKAVVDHGDAGLEIRPLGVELMRRGDIDPGLVSTVSVRFVPVEPAEQRPKRRGPEVIREVRERSDVQRLATILGDLTYTADFVPASRRWIVAVSDQQGRLVREALVADDG